MKNHELGETPADPRPSEPALPLEFKELAINTIRANMTPAQKARVKAEEIYNQYWSDVNRKNIKPSDPLPDIRPLLAKALLEFAQPPEPKIAVQTAIELRDRATQVALNFAGQRISSSDGSYELLIGLIQDAMADVLGEALIKYQKEPTDVQLKHACQCSECDPL